MKKVQSTNRALLMSVMALFLCFTMLLGTTFAWFTDSVTSAGNKIMSGTLNIEMYYAKGTEDPASAEWKNAQGVAIYTADQLWEPGYTDAKHIKISNEGSLALKYQMAIIPTGEVSKLAEVIDVYLYQTEGVLENATQITARTAINEAMKVGTLAEVISKGIVHGTLEADTDYTTTIVLKMQENANNDYQNLKIGDDFTIRLLATQYTAESDSFDNTYDENAWMEGMVCYDADDLVAAMANGGTVILGDDIELTEATFMAGNYPAALHIDETTVLNLNGKKLEIDGEKLAFAMVIENGGNLTITGEGTFYCDRLSCAVVGGGSTLTIENGNFIHPNSTGLFIEATPNYSEYYKDTPATVNIYGGTFDCGANPRYLLNEQAAYEGQSINVYGGSFKNFDPANGNDGSYLAGGIKSVKVEDENGVWYHAMPDGTTMVSSAAELATALANGESVILVNDVSVSETLTVNGEPTIYGSGKTISRAAGYTGTVLTVASGATLTVENLVLDGSGATATGNLIKTTGNGKIVLNEGTVLQNNNGAHAVYLDHGSKKGSLTLNRASIINNSSDSGAIWGGGQITVNEGSKINNNSSTGSAGAIRMVSGCNLTMNGGEISNNTAAASGGAIYGYGSSTYNFNGGKMANNTAAVGGAMYTGDVSVVNISGSFEMIDNTANDAGAIRLTNRTSFNMTGGKVSGNISINDSDWNGFYGWNPAVNISGGELADDIYIQGGLTPTVGGSGITGVVHFDVSTNHNTVNLASDFGTFKFTVAEGSNFAAFNLKPATGYVYTEGDEAKLVCMNEGYETYWDATTSTFKLQAK